MTESTSHQRKLASSASLFASVCHAATVWLPGGGSISADCGAEQGPVQGEMTSVGKPFASASKAPMVWPPAPTAGELVHEGGERYLASSLEQPPATQSIESLTTSKKRCKQWPPPPPSPPTSAILARAAQHDRSQSPQSVRTHSPTSLRLSRGSQGSRENLQPRGAEQLKPLPPSLGLDTLNLPGATRGAEQSGTATRRVRYLF